MTLAEGIAALKFVADFLAIQSNHLTTQNYLHISCNQSDQIGLFLECLGNKFSDKSSPNITQFLAIFGNNGASFFSIIWPHCL